ncbi:MAG: hypothetical protein WBB37_10915 [bacterium]
MKLLRFLLLFLLSCPLFSIELPLEFHGRGFLGKYLNSDTTRYNMDASVELYCTILRHGKFSFFSNYQDDLDMAEQTGGVSLDPRYAHYYIVGGFDMVLTNFMIATFFMHDCVHDIDYEVEGTPVFNRFRIQIADADFHKTRRLLSEKKFLWSIMLGAYPHWTYNGWDINAGADYKYEFSVESVFTAWDKGNFGIELNPRFHLTTGDSLNYHQHLLRFISFYRNNGKRIGLELTYNLWNNDIIKDPDRLWLLSVFAEF